MNTADLIIDYKKNMAIDKPCIIRNMPIDVYHSVKGLSNSGIKTLLDCPAKYYYKYLSGEYEPKEKPQFKIGKACHTYILEGKETFEKIYWHNPYSSAKKEDLVKILQNKFGYDCSIKKYLVNDLIELLLDNEQIERKQIELNYSELNQVISIGRAINNNKYAKNAFSQKGESELSIFWQDEETGIWLKCRPDFLPYDCKLVPDYKTCASANPQTFYGDFIKYGYHIQSALYRIGIYEVTKYLLDNPIEVESFFFVAQEKEPPYITQVYLPDMSIVDFGEKSLKLGIQKYQNCIKTGIWETYSDRIIEMSIQEKPDDILNNFDSKNAICYAPKWVDSELTKYEV